MSSNTVAIIEMLVVLKEDCVCIKDIQEKTGLAPGTVIRYIKLLHRRKLIRIAEWRKYGLCHSWVPHYEWNPEDMRDVPKPRKMTAAERQARCRSKKTLRAAGVPI